MPTQRKTLRTPLQIRTKFSLRIYGRSNHLARSLGKLGVPSPVTFTNAASRIDLSFSKRRSELTGSHPDAAVNPGVPIFDVDQFATSPFHDRMVAVKHIPHPSKVSHRCKPKSFRKASNFRTLIASRRYIIQSAFEEVRVDLR